MHLYRRSGNPCAHLGSALLPARARGSSAPSTARTAQVGEPFGPDFRCRGVPCRASTQTHHSQRDHPAGDRRCCRTGESRGGLEENRTAQCHSEPAFRGARRSARNGRVRGAIAERRAARSWSVWRVDDSSWQACGRHRMSRSGAEHVDGDSRRNGVDVSACGDVPTSGRSPVTGSASVGKRWPGTQDEHVGLVAVAHVVG